MTAITSRQIKQAIDQDKSIRLYLRAFLKHIHDLTMQQGFAFCSDKYLAEKQNVCTRTIKNWLKKLEDSGWLVREVYYVRKGSHYETRRRMKINSKKVYGRATFCPAINSINSKHEYEHKDSILSKKELTQDRQEIKNNTELPQKPKQIQDLQKAFSPLHEKDKIFIKTTYGESLFLSRQKLLKGINCGPAAAQHAMAALEKTTVTDPVKYLETVAKNYESKGALWKKAKTYLKNKFKKPKKKSSGVDIWGHPSPTLSSPQTTSESLRPTFDPQRRPFSLEGLRELEKHI